MKKLTPLKAVRVHCLDCCGGSAKEVRFCTATECDTHPIRDGKNCGKVKSVIKAIRKRCLDCSGFSPKAVRECAHELCALWQYRFGTNPARKKY
jgi:hypothetical protein